MQVFLEWSRNGKIRCEECGFVGGLQQGAVMESRPCEDAFELLRKDSTALLWCRCPRCGTEAMVDPVSMRDSQTVSAHGEKEALESLYDSAAPIGSTAGSGAMSVVAFVDGLLFFVALFLIESHPIAALLYAGLYVFRLAWEALLRAAYHLPQIGPLRLPDDRAERVLALTFPVAAVTGIGRLAAIVLLVVEVV